MGLEIILLVALGLLPWLVYHYYPRPKEDPERLRYQAWARCLADTHKIELDIGIRDDPVPDGYEIDGKWWPVNGKATGFDVPLQLAPDVVATVDSQVSYTPLSGSELTFNGYIRRRYQVRMAEIESELYRLDARYQDELMPPSVKREWASQLEVYKRLGEEIRRQEERDRAKREITGGTPDVVLVKQSSFRESTSFGGHIHTRETAGMWSLKTPAGFINLPEGCTDEQARELRRQIQRKIDNGTFSWQPRIEAGTVEIRHEDVVTIQQRFAEVFGQKL